MINNGMLGVHYHITKFGITMNRSYDGQYIWIIGASSGIGKALALELSKRGATLALSARRQDQLEYLKNECEGDNHIIVPCDVGETDSTRHAFETIQSQFPQLNSCIFMAAIYSTHDGKPKDISFIQDMIRVNIGGAYNILDSIVPYYESQQAGQIAICASVAGFKGLPTGQPYCSTKAALINLCESLKIDLGKSNIDVKVINPGFVKTPLTDKNNFPMPMIITADKAAHCIANDLLTKKFEIHFPKKFTYLMKIIHLLPNWLYFIIARQIR